MMLAASERVRKYGEGRLKVRMTAWLLVVFLGLYGGVAAAQESTDPQAGDSSSSRPDLQREEASSGPVDIKSLPKNLFLDQKAFFTAPFHMTQKQWEWAVPSVLFGAVLIASDRSLEKHVPTNPTTASHAVTASNAGVAALAGAGAGLFLLG